MGTAVHRIIEHQAASRPDATAVAGDGRALTYREMNQRANTLARRLGESGLARGSLALVRMPRCTDLAIVLLAVLKAGAAYAWIAPGSPGDLDLPASFSIAVARRGAEEQFLALDIVPALAAAASRPGPNLPVLTRGADLACVLLDAGGLPHVLVPHATIAALLPPAAGRSGTAGDAAGALDLWLGLMSGATMRLGATRPATAAA
ncbi:MAG: AMP-binding protein [Burkholderiales bacterium]